MSGGRQLFLCLFGFFLQTLQRKLVIAQVDAFFLFELISQIVDDAHVEIFPAEEGVAIGGAHFKHAVADFKNRYVEGTTAQVINSDGAVAALVHAVSQSRSGWLVDDAQHFKASNLACVLGGLALSVVEIGRHSDDGLGHGLAQIGFRSFLHLGQDHGRDFRRAVILVAARHISVAARTFGDLVGNQIDVLLDHRVVKRAADKALDGEEGLFWVGDGLTASWLADQALPICSKGDDRRRGARTFRVFNHFGCFAVHDGYAGIGGPEVDTDDFAHVLQVP